MSENSSICELIITNDIFDEAQNLAAILRSEGKLVRIFPLGDEFKKGEFKIKHAREAIDESCIAESRLKTIILAGEKFNIEAQNALLKVLEEPPPNVKFILIAKHKNGILPTILSRLLVKNKRKKAQILRFPLNVENLGFGEIMKFVEGFGFQSKQEDSRILLASLLNAVNEAKFALNQKELDCFHKALCEIETYEQPKYIFLKLLLMLRNYKRRAR